MRGLSKIQKNWKWQAFLRSLLKNALLITGIAVLFYDSLLSALPLAAALIPLIRKDMQAAKNRDKERLSAEFREALQSMKTAMRAGYAAENAVTEALREMKTRLGADASIVSELQLVQNEIRLHVPMETALKHFADRTRIEDIEDFATIFQTAKRTGGDLIAIMDSTAETIADRQQLKREIQTSLAAKQMEWKVMTVVPFGILLYMRVSFPAFMESLYGNLAGAAVMTVALLIIAGAYAMGQRILRIEV